MPSFFGVDPFNGWFFFGKRGVDFFFVLSGFIIAYAHWKDFGKASRIPTYVKKRFVRIYPLLWVVVAPLLVIKLLTHAEDMPTDTSQRIGAIITSLTLLPSAIQPIPVVVWTLRYEIFFYLVFACVLWKPKPALVALLVWAGLCLRYCAAGGEHQFPASFFLGPYNLEFMLGVGTAYLLKTRKIPFPKAVAIFGTVLFVLLGINYNLHHTTEGFSSLDEFYNVVEFGLTSAILVLGIGQLDFDQANRWVTPLLRLLGSASYSIYLLHFPLISPVCKVLKIASGFVPMSPLFCAIVAVIASTIGGVLLHLWVEQPIISYFRPSKSTDVSSRTNELAAVVSTATPE